MSKTSGQAAYEKFMTLRGLPASWDELRSDKRQTWEAAAQAAIEQYRVSNVVVSYNGDWQGVHLDFDD